MNRISRLALCLPVAGCASAFAAHFVEPEGLAVLAAKGERSCGVAADYSLSGSILRVELEGRKTGDGGMVLIRAYAPNSVGPPMRDVWLKTTTLFTLGRFKQARENSQGILESSGAVSLQETAAVVREIADGNAEISLVFDGVLPAARVAVGLPTPLPAEIAATLNDCATALEK